MAKAEAKMEENPIKKNEQKYHKEATSRETGLKLKTLLLMHIFISV